MIIAQLATIPERASILPRVIKSLIDQVDHINVAMAIDMLNDDIITKANTLPECLKSSKVFVTFHDNALQDGARWINAPQEPDHYVLVCDDDIEYPPDYAATMVRLCNHPFNLRAILSCMGKKLKPRPIQSFFKDEILCLKTFEKVDAFYSVEIPCACSLIYHTSRITISVNDIESVNSDICVGVIAKRKGVQCFVVPHDADWLTNLMPELPQGSPNLFDKYKNNDEALTKYINENL